MDLLPIGFLVFLALIGGAIALASDEAGRKLGKKRLSVFGLRPRHTARLGTFVLGIVISFITIIGVSIVSSGVRQWILEGRKAIVELRVVQDKLAESHQKLQAEQSTINRYQSSISIQRNQIHQGETLVSRQDAKMEAQRQLLTLLQVKEAAFKSELQQTEQTIKSRDAEIKLTQSKLAANRNRLAQVQSTLSQTSLNLQNSLKHAYALRVENENLTRDIAAQKSDLADLRIQMTGLQSQKEGLGRELDTTQSALNATKASAAIEAATLKNLRASEADLDAAISQDRTYFTSTVLPSRVEPEIYGVGQEVVRMAVPDHLSLAEAGNVLESALRTARSVAEARGAKARGKYRSADIIDLPDGASGEERKAKTVEELTGNQNPQVLILTAYVNTFQGEPLAVDPDVRENPRVFKKGEIVAESRIDGARSDKDIYQALSDFLGRQVRNRARERRMIPEGPEESFGTVSNDEVWQTVDEIKSAGRTVRLQAIAMDDTHAADPLKLDLQIK